MKRFIKIIFLVIVFIIVVFAILGLKNDWFKPLPVALQSTGLNSHFSSYNASNFDEYISASNTMIQNARGQVATKAFQEGSMTKQQVHDYTSPAVIGRVAPFHESVAISKSCPKGAVGAIVFVDGTYSSPAGSVGIAQKFHDHCYDVRAVLLPGHGTTAGDLLDTNAEDFENAVHYAVESAHQNSDNVIVFGESLGGSLALLEAMKYKDVSHVIAFAPAIYPKGEGLFPVANTLKNILFFAPKFRYASIEGAQSPLRDAHGYRYFFNTIHSAMAVRKVAMQVRSDLKNNQLTEPALVLSSDVDKTVDLNKTKKYFEKYFPKGSELMIFSAAVDSLEVKKDVKGLYFITVPIVTKSLDGKTIVSYSHVNLMRLSNDSVYGVNSFKETGEKIGCEHLLSEPELLKKCRSNQFMVLGETTKANLKEHPNLERLVYNPSDVRMMGGILEFLEAPASP